MTEVMLHSPVGENFSFSDSKFKHIPSETRSHLLLDESTVIFTEKMDVGSDQSSQSTICGSNSNTSLITNGVQDSSNRTKKGNAFCKYVSSDTTVVSETCNEISKSVVRGIRKNPMVQHLNPTGVMTGDTDKSRVIVQILSSDSEKTTETVKSQNIIENKSTNVENQSTHSFRDDVFKILSKSQSSKINIVNNIKERKNIKKVAAYTKAQRRIKRHTSLKCSHKEDKNFSEALNTSFKSQAVSLEINGSTQIERNRRKRSLKSYFLFGGGPKISDLQHVSSYLKTATPNALRIVHYVLYDKYGLCSNELQVSQTKKQILCFCGYPFNKNSREYAKRLNCLQKIPRPILFEVHQAIFGKTCLKNRELMVQQLMDFFLKPKRYHKIVDEMKQSMQFMLDKECSKLKERALKGPCPYVSLQRLTMEDLERIKNKIKMESAQSKEHEVPVEDEKVIPKDTGSICSYSLPAYILKGPGEKLQYFSSIVTNVKNAKEKFVVLLHYLLYGRIESKSVEVCRRNILEFSGFLECQTEFIAERNATLLRLENTELSELCKILCLRGTTNSKGLRIKKIMQYLVAPHNPIKINGNAFGREKLALKMMGSSFGSKYSMSESFEPRKTFKKKPVLPSSFGAKYTKTESSEPRKRFKKKHLVLPRVGSSFGSKYSISRSSEPRNTFKEKLPALQTHDYSSSFKYSVSESSEPRNTFKEKIPALQTHDYSSSSKYSVSESSEPRKNDEDEQLALQRHSSTSGSMSESSEPRGIQPSTVSISNSSTKVESDGGWRLRDFKKICSNIECSAPSDLTELNDLLFVQPCDETEIHEKILNFTQFSFSDSSTEYHYRKTLMFYMGPCIVRKIAKLLDIRHWNMESSLEHLSSSILNFLKKKETLDSSSVKPSLSPVPLPSYNSIFAEAPKSEQKSLQPETFEENTRNEAIPLKKERVCIHRLSKSSDNSSGRSSIPSSDIALLQSNNRALVPSSCMNGKNGIRLPDFDPSNDDSMPLRVFIHHPSDQELLRIISNIIENDLWYITLGDLVQMVYNRYPQFNLMYREMFIKTQARQMLSALRSNAVSFVQDMAIKGHSHIM